MVADSDDAAQAVQALRIGIQDYVIRGESEPVSLGRSIRHAIERHRLLRKLRQAGDQARFLATHQHQTDAAE